MKFLLGDIVFYIRENKVHSAPVLGKQIIETVKDILNIRAEFGFGFGPSRIQYQTCHGIFDQSEVFKSKEKLLESL